MLFSIRCLLHRQWCLLLCSLSLILRGVISWLGLILCGLISWLSLILCGLISWTFSHFLRAIIPIIVWAGCCCRVFFFVIFRVVFGVVISVVFLIITVVPIIVNFIFFLILFLVGNRASNVPPPM